jgi:hypothetical protein
MRNNLRKIWGVATLTIDVRSVKYVTREGWKRLIL